MPRRCAACGREALAGYPSGVSVCRACELERHVTIVNGAYLDPETGEARELTPELFVERSGWRFAKTMPRDPHEYTVRDLVNPDARRSTCLSHDTFEWFVRHVRERGDPGGFGGRAYVYLELGGLRYWTMGYPLEVTTIINRARTIA